MRSIPFVIALFLAGCTGPIETRVDSRGMTAVQPVSFAVDPMPVGLRLDAQNMVAKALLGKGYSAGEMAKLSLQVTVSDRPADLSLRAGSDVLAPAAGKKSCAKREYRLGIMLTEIANGSLYYQSHAAEYHCKQTIQQALPILVDAALKDIGAPRGSYIVKRRR